MSDLPFDLAYFREPAPDPDPPFDDGLDPIRALGDWAVLLDAISGMTGTAPPTTGPHSWWRIRINSMGPVGFPPCLAAVEFFSALGGANIAVGGTPIASSVYALGWEAANAFDGNDATKWSASASSPQWIGYNFPAPVSVVEVLLRSRSDFGDQPTAFDVQYSDDGAAWSTLYSAVPLNWGAGVSRRFSGFGILTAVEDRSGNARPVTVVGPAAFGPAKWSGGGGRYAAEMLIADDTRLLIPIPDIPQPFSFFTVVDEYQDAGGNDNLVNAGAAGGGTNAVSYIQSLKWTIYGGGVFPSGITPASATGKCIRFDIFNGDASKVFRTLTYGGTGSSGAGSTGADCILSIGGRNDGADPCSAIIAAFGLAPWAFSDEDIATIAAFYTARFPGIT